MKRDFVSTIHIHECVYVQFGGGGGRGVGCEGLRASSVYIRSAQGAEETKGGSKSVLGAYTVYTCMRGNARVCVCVTRVRWGMSF